MRSCIDAVAQTVVESILRLMFGVAWSGLAEKTEGKVAGEAKGEVVYCLCSPLTSRIIFSEMLAGLRWSVVDRCGKMTAVLWLMRM